MVLCPAERSRRTGAFFFFTRENFALRLGDPQLTPVPAPAMANGDSSSVPHPIFDPMA
jgi:hypothetical protein